jgi:hypothetical protein
LKLFALVFAVPFLAWPLTWRSMLLDSLTRRVYWGGLLLRSQCSFEDIQAVVESDRAVRARDPETGDDLTRRWYSLYLVVGSKNVLLNEWSDPAARESFKARIQPMLGVRAGRRTSG